MLFSSYTGLKSATSSGQSTKLATLAYGTYNSINNVLLSDPARHVLLTLSNSLQYHFNFTTSVIFISWFSWPLPLYQSTFMSKTSLNH